MNSMTGSIGAPQLMGAVGIIACITIAYTLNSDDREKIIRNRSPFWGLGGAFSGFWFVAMLPDWKSGLEAAVVFGMWFVGLAFLRTPFLKIRGRIYAARWRHRQAESTDDDSETGRDRIPDSYDGSAPAGQTWWWLVVGYLVCLGAILGDFVAHNIHYVGIPVAIVAVYMPLYLGYWDASWDYPVARGQQNQFAMLTLMTAGIFAALYFAAFQAGMRWPWRPKRSMEYRAHPRHRRED